jgi:RecA-family ATPase
MLEHTSVTADANQDPTLLVSPEWFLTAILPEQGLYCATVAVEENFRDYFFDIIEEMASFILEQDKMAGQTVYHCCATLNSRKGRRRSSNVHSLQALRIDIDAGDGKPYATFDDALRALARFCQRTGLPIPLVVSSGIGLHCYWLLDRPRSLAEWQPLARLLASACEACGLGVDKKITTNPVALLRTPGTHHRKASPKLVQSGPLPGRCADETLEALLLAVPGIEATGARANGVLKPDTLLAAASNISTAPPFLPAEVERVKAALNQINPCSRDTWCDVGTGLRWLRRHGWDDDVLFDIFDCWSANCRGVGTKGPRYNPTTQQTQWQSFDNKDVANPLTIASVYAMAAEGAGCGCLCIEKVPEPPVGPFTSPASATAAPLIVTRLSVPQTLKSIPLPEDDQLGCHDIPSFTNIPPRATLYGDYLIRKLISVVIGPAGSGKSILSMAEALAMATGKPLLGISPPDSMRVFYWNGEDDIEELKRRFAALCAQFNVTEADYGDRLWFESYERLKVKIVEIDARSRTALVTPVRARLVSLIQRRQIDVLIIDPFVASHAVTENDNNQIEQVASAWRDVAQEGNCAVSLVHHTRKPPAGSNSGQDANDARGASALVAAARSVRVAATMTDADAKTYGIPNESRFDYFSTAHDKTNFGRRGRIDWYTHREFGTYPRACGVVLPWTPPSKAKAVSDEQRADILHYAAEGTWRRDRQAKQHWFGEKIAEVLGLDLGKRHVKSEIARMIAGWIKDGTLKEVLRLGPQRKSVPHVVPANWSEPKGETPAGKSLEGHVVGMEDGDE